jgi:hypothetical protein
VAGDPTYNLATGTQILASKWMATNCVGDNQPAIVEDWYSAAWAYNGLSYSNNPNNPNLDANRGVYDPQNGGSYAYQERVFGWVEHPPGASYWTAVALAYPNRADVGGNSSPPNLPEPTCASPTDCAGQRGVHPTACGPPTMPDMAMPPGDASGPANDLAGGDAAARDARPSGDAGTGDGEAGMMPGGCGCRIGGARRGASAVWAALLLVAWRSRRRRR